MKKLVAVLVLVMVVGAVAYAKLRGSGASAQDAALRPTVPVSHRSLDISAEASGLVEPVEVIEVKSKASGEVLKVLADSGDRVEKGALLATIDPRDVQSALAQAQADRDSAKVRSQVSSAHEARMKTLRDSQTVTQEEYESAVDAASAARASLVRADAALQLAKERSQDVTIRAPSSGTILTRTVQPGGIIASATSNVSGGTTLFSMADLSQMQVRAQVSEADIGRIAAGQTARITVQSYPGKTFTGKVMKIEPQAVVDQNVTLFPVLIRVDNQAGLLRPGMNAEVAVEITHREGVVAVPSSAVVAPKDAFATARALGVDASSLRGAGRSGKGGSGRGARGAAGQQGGSAQPDGALAGDGGPGVLFVEKAGAIAAVKVTLGLSDWEYTEVKSGLSGDEQIVLVSAAQQVQAQQQQTDRMKQRMSGPVPGMGGGSRRGGGK
jgi:HlyD family secretion protein